MQFGYNATMPLPGIEKSMDRWVEEMNHWMSKKEKSTLSKTLVQQKDIGDLLEPSLGTHRI